MNLSKTLGHMLLKASFPPSSLRRGFVLSLGRGFSLDKGRGQGLDKGRGFSSVEVLSPPSSSSLRPRKDLDLRSRSFLDEFQKCNSSISNLRGSVIECSVQQVRGDMVVVDTGLKTPTVLFKSELSDNIVMGIEEMEVFGESKVTLPKTLESIRQKNAIWAELHKIWRSNNNRVRGFLLNTVNGGYAVAIAGHIAFLPRSLLKNRKCFRNQWRTFSILNMNILIGNIVVKEIADRSRSSLRR